jgi:hypothetical protein
MTRIEREITRSLPAIMLQGTNEGFGFLKCLFQQLLVFGHEEEDVCWMLALIKRRVTGFWMNWRRSRI